MSPARQRLTRRTGFEDVPTIRSAGDWDLVAANLLKDPRAFSASTWTKTRSYIAANCVADPVSGQFTVDKLVEDYQNGAHYMLQSITLPTDPHVLNFVVKSAGRGLVWVVFGGSTTKGAKYNLDTGAVSNIAAGYTASMRTVGDGYYLCQIAGPGASNAYLLLISDGAYQGLGHQGTAAAGGDTNTAILAAAASATDDVYNGTEIIFSDAPTTIHTVTDYNGTTKACDFTPARAAAPDTTTYTVGPGILIARAQLNPGTTPWTFYDGGDMQTWAPTYGIGGNVVLGAGSSADANDPAIVGTGLSFAGSHFAKSASLGAAKGFDLAFYVGTAVDKTTSTMCLLGLPWTAYSYAGLWLGVASGGQTNEIVSLIEASANGQVASWCHASENIPIGWHVLQMNWTGAAWQLWIDNVEKPLTLVGTLAGFSASGIVQLGSSQVPSSYLTGIIGHYQHHTVSRSASQRARDYRAVQAAMARKAVTVPS